ncbi:MAG: tocopherol cyclase family protein [Firmicutes bacterium]|nr:tocopherol cyclase family protein [Bacillota bacterium]
MYWLRRIWSPELFQGIYKSKNYFEGWYYKLISADYKHIYAVIPGIALGPSPADAQAFIQVINGQTGRAYFFKYPFSDFTYDQRRFAIAIGGSSFSQEAISLNLATSGLQISGELNFHDIIPFPKTFINPGIMGPYSFVPFMECYHCIVNVNHKISGELRINGHMADFSSGEGYLEKDYGKSFPREWIWIQANHFDGQQACFMFSLARIPWLGSSFIGLICFLLIGSQIYRFATYNGAKLDRISLQDKVLQATIVKKDQVLVFKATGSPGGFLQAPKNGLMTREIEESITTRVEVMLTDANDIIFSGQSDNCGMELSTGVEQLIS